MLTPYSKIISEINDLVNLFKKFEIWPGEQSFFIRDLKSATAYVDAYDRQQDTSALSQEREALGGFHELYKWVWPVKCRVEFPKLLPHLKLLTDSATRINSSVGFKNETTRDKSNKLIETILGLFSVCVGSEVDLDDPLQSSGGANPDVLLSFNSQRIAFACKTLQRTTREGVKGTTKEALRDNIVKAANQIKRASCDFGYIAINAMNIIEHEAIDGLVFDVNQAANGRTAENLIRTIDAMLLEVEDDFFNVFNHAKVRPVVLIFAHATGRIALENGIAPMMLKEMIAREIPRTAGISAFDENFLSSINEFIHGRDPLTCF